MKDTDESKKREFRVWSYWGLFADTVSGYLSWSFASHLPPTLFFIPLVKMSYSGWEFFMFTWSIAGLLAFPSVRKVAGKYPFLFRLLSLLGFLSQCVEDTGARIGVVALGILIDSILQTKSHRRGWIRSHLFLWNIIE